MGQNMVGWLNVTLKGEKGEPVRLRFAETLKPDGSLYMDNLRGAKVTDVYIPAGDDVFSWEPRFTYHGFRFVEITGLKYKPELKSFVGKVVYDDMKTIGRFETSDPTINQVFKNAYWGIRGNYRSVPMEQLLAEAASLAEQGVKELILVAQETTLYGVDLYGKKSLHILLQELAKIKGIRWIRILYCYPEEIYPELIETIKNEKKVCHYLDMPIQHASDAILKRMGRRTTKAQLKETVSLLRKEIPDIVLRTTLIAGFPGETQEQHEELMEFVDEMEFERLGVFAYSPEENTPAASMPDQIPEEIKEERRDAILELQQEIAFDKAADMVGRTLYAMIEGKVADEPAYVARTYADSPDIDGYVFVNTGEMLMSGDFVKVKITGSAEYDLIGELV